MTVGAFVLYMLLAIGLNIMDPSPKPQPTITPAASTQPAAPTNAPDASTTGAPPAVDTAQPPATSPGDSSSTPPATNPGPSGGI